MNRLQDNQPWSKCAPSVRSIARGDGVRGVARGFAGDAAGAAHAQDSGDSVDPVDAASDVACEARLGAVADAATQLQSPDGPLAQW